MNYSFLHAKPKPLISFFSVLWLLFIGICASIVIIVAVYFYATVGFLKDDMINLSEDLTNIQANILSTKEKILNLEGKKLIYDDINSSNTLCYKSIKNLFDLVPDSIVLNEVVMDSNNLTLKGTTPTKDVFNTLLQAPLKSIFTVSTTSFYQLDNGYFNFTSINMLEKNEGFNE